MASNLSIFVPLPQRILHPLRAHDNHSGIIKQVEFSIVTMFAYDRKGKVLGQGRGFLVSSGDIITNLGAQRSIFRRNSSAHGKVYSIRNVIAQKGGNEKSGLIKTTEGGIDCSARGWVYI